MRAAILVAASLAVPLLAGPAAAQPAKTWTAAPVPGTTADNGPPSDRAGSTSGPINASPFSGTPTGALSDNGRTSTTSTGTMPANDVATPNVSR